MGTKSNRSAGSQFTPNGPVQGTVLVDPATGEPVSTTGGKLDTTATFSGTLEVHLSADNDSVAIADPSNLAHVLKPNADGSINADVVLSSSTDSIRADQGNPALPANAWPVKPTDGTNSQSYTGAGEAKISVTQPLPAGTNNLGSIKDVTGTVSLPTNAAQETGGHLASIDGKLNSLGQKAMAASVPVVVASDQSPVPTTETNNTSSLFVSPNSAVTRVAVSNVSATLLALNTSRKGAVFYNETGAILYLKLGITASATSYTIQVFPNGTFILDDSPIYTGRVDGILSTGSGNVQVTELT